MQVSMHETLDKLQGSHKLRPVMLEEIIAMGEGAKLELAVLEQARKIIQSKMTKDGKTENHVYLSAQIVERARAFVIPDSKPKEPPKEPLKYCAKCDTYKKRNQFNFKCRCCIECNIKHPAFKKRFDKESKEPLRVCMICEVTHPASAFEGRSRKCIATKAQHKAHANKLIVAANRRFFEKKKMLNKNGVRK